MKKSKAIWIWIVLFLSLIGYFVAVNERQKRLQNLSQETEEMIETMRELARERLRWRAKLKAERKAYDDAVAADRKAYGEFWPTRKD